MRRNLEPHTGANLLVVCTLWGIRPGDRVDPAYRRGLGCDRWVVTSSESTISRPSGTSDTGMSFRFAIARGIPMIVTASAIAVSTCPSASHQPAKMIHTMLPIIDGAPELA